MVFLIPLDVLLHLLVTIEPLDRSFSLVYLALKDNLVVFRHGLRFESLGELEGLVWKTAERVSRAFPHTLTSATSNPNIP